MKKLAIVIVLMVFVCMQSSALATQEEETADQLSQYLQQAEAGDAEAQYQLGQLYYDGDGVERDYEQALAWYESVSLYYDDADDALYDLLYAGSGY